MYGTRRSVTPRCISTRLLAFLSQIIQEICPGHDMNAKTLRAVRTVSVITICIKPVCQDCHKTVSEFILLILYMMWMKITY